MRRRHMSKRGSRRDFRSNASKVHRKNLAGPVMRGGIRL